MGMVLELRNISKSFDNKVVIKEFSRRKHPIYLVAAFQRKGSGPWCPVTIIIRWARISE